MMWAYPPSDYTDIQGPKRGFFRAIWDSINFSTFHSNRFDVAYNIWVLRIGDFGREIWGSIVFFVHYWRGKPGTRSSHKKNEEKRYTDFNQAFRFVHCSLVLLVVSGGYSPLDLDCRYCRLDNSTSPNGDGGRPFLADNGYPLQNVGRAR